MDLLHPKKAGGADHKRFMEKYYRRSAGLKGPVQEMPVFDCRVEVEPSLKDYWGIPVAKISGSRHAEDVKTGRFIAERAAELLREAGATDVFLSAPGRGVSGGQHQAGTCRMGDDPKTSVTTKHGKLHEADNVFVVDGSLHVTNGGFNPSLTIQALAFWCSAYIVREWRGARFR